MAVASRTFLALASTRARTYTHGDAHRADKTFKEMVSMVFERVQDEKLRAVDVRRFEKAWVLDAALMFYECMDAGVQVPSLISLPAHTHVIYVYAHKDAHIINTNIHIRTTCLLNKFPLAFALEPCGMKCAAHGGASLEADGGRCGGPIRPEAGDGHLPR